MHAPATCPLCALAPRETLLLRAGIPVRQCPACGLGWWDWPDFEPAQFYDQDYFQSAEVPRGYNDYAALEHGVRRTARARLRRIRSILQQNHPYAAADDGSLFEIGAGTGLFLDEAVRLGWRTSGCEVSPFAACTAAARGLDVQCSAAESLELRRAAFDAVVLWDVIEHLRDPLAVATAAAGALRPGGVLALSTGDVQSWLARLCGRRWHLYNLPEHLFFFSVPSLRKMLEREGLRVIWVTREWQWVSLGYLWERLAKTLFASSGRVSSQRGPLKWVLPATLFDIVGVYAIRD